MLERRFRSSLVRLTATLTGQLVLVGVSGGGDSSALLLLTECQSQELGYRCEAAYFDHEIRNSSERAAELQTVQKLTGSLGILLHLGCAPVPANARAQKRSLEEQARLERYAFLGRVAVARGASFVAMGHTADDQAETILLNIIRGSGLRGLTGMAASQPWPYGPGPQLIRPLLGFCRSDTAAYCATRGVVPHEDSQNLSPRYRRNQIRQNLLPLMRQSNPRVVEALIRLGDSAREQLHAVLEIAEVPESDQVTLLAALPAAIRNELFAEQYAVAAGSRRGLSARHRAALDALIRANGEHSLDLPGGVEARLARGRLTFGPKPKATLEESSAGLAAAPLAIPGSMQFGNWQICSEVLPAGAIREPDKLTAVMDTEDAGEGLTVRAWRAADRMQLTGMKGRKKLQDIFVDAKVPRSERKLLPLLCINGEIVWVAGLRASARAAVRDSRTERIAISARLLDAPGQAAIG